MTEFLAVAGADPSGIPTADTEPNGSQTSQIDRLLASNQLLHDAIIDIANLLREPSRRVGYCPQPVFEDEHHVDDGAQPAHADSSPTTEGASSEGGGRSPRPEALDVEPVENNEFERANTEARLEYSRMKEEFACDRPWSDYARVRAYRCSWFVALQLIASSLTTY
jgi:hypothetical protein